MGIKLSAITPSGSNPVAADQFVGVTGGTTDVLFSGTQLNAFITGSTGKVAIATGKTLTASNSLTLAGTDGSTLNVGAGGTLGAVAFITPGTGVATALGVNIGSAGAFVTFGGALGTPSSGVATNLTGTSGITGLGTQGQSLLFTDNSFDIGAVGATRPRAGYFGTSLTIGAGSAITSSGAGGALGTNAFTSTAYAPLASPTFTGLVTVNDNTVSSPGSAVNTALLVQGADNIRAAFEIQTYGASANTYSRIAARRFGGTAAVPTATPAAAILGENDFGGWDGSAIQLGAAIRATSITLWAAGDRSAAMDFFVTPSASTTFTNGMRLQGTGGLSVGPANVGTDGGAGVVVATSYTGAGTGLTGTAASLTAGTVTTNANLTGPITSVGNATSVAAQTGTGTTFVMSVGPTLTGSLTLSSAALITSGNLSAAAWTTNGVRTQMAAASYTDTSSSGTVANAYTDLFGVGTILASSATTYTSYYGAFFKAPVASTNVTMTNKSALGADSISIGGAAQSTFALAVTGTMSISGASTLTGSVSAASGISISVNSPTALNLTNNSAAIALRNGGTTLSSPASASFQHGAADVDTAPVAQTIRSQGALAGGTSDVAGANFTFLASPGKGTGAGGSFIFQTTPAGSTGTVVGTATTALTINSTQSAIFAGTTDATSTSTGAVQIAGGMSITKRVFAAGLTASAGLQTAVICLSSANELIADSVACLASSEDFKEIVDVPRVGLKAILEMDQINYRYALTGNPRFDNAPNQRAIHPGLGAQAVARIDPRLVAYDADGKVRTIRQDSLSAAIVRAIQEQQVEINALKRGISRH